jgi:hypothetical protein
MINPILQFKIHVLVPASCCQSRIGKGRSKLPGLILLLRTTHWRCGTAKLGCHRPSEADDRTTRQSGGLSMWFARLQTSQGEGKAGTGQL